MIFGCDLKMIIDYKRQNCRLPFVDFAKFANFGIVEKKNSIKCEKRDTKEIHYDHTIVDEQIWADIPSRAKVAQSHSSPFEFHKSIFNSDIIISVFVFSFFEVSKFVEVFWVEFIGKNLGNLCF